MERYRPPEYQKNIGESPGLPDYLEMYEVSGQDSITVHAYERYQKDKDRYDEAIESEIESRGSGTRKEISVDDVKKEKFLKALRDKDVEALGKTCFIVMRKVSGEEKEELAEKLASVIEESLDGDDSEAQKVLIKQARFASESKRAALIMKGLEIDDIEVQQVSATEIRKAPAQERPKLEGKVLDRIQEGLDNSDIHILKIAVKMLGIFGSGMHPQLEKQVAVRVEEGLKGSNIKEQQMYAEMIERAPIGERSKLKNTVGEIIIKGLGSDESEVQKVSAEMIPFAKKNKLVEFIGLGLESSSVEAQKVCAEMVRDVSASEKDKLQDRVVELITQGFQGGSIDDQRIYAEMIKFVPGEDIYSLIEQALGNEDIEVRKRATELISSVPQNEEQARKALYMIAMRMPANFLVESPLYDKDSVSKEEFSRKAFHKDGSETTLVGGELKDKTIIRHIEPDAFVTWQELYEDHELWKQRRFDYVPIEPIQSFRLNKKGFVDVFSGILDLNLSAWKQKSDRFVSELEEDRDRILSVLDSRKIKHGHAHDKNFVLRFYRDEDGNVDFSKKPRIYLIDFDESVSTA